MSKLKKYIVLLCGYSGAISGGDEHALQLVSDLCKIGYDVTVILPNDAYKSRIDSHVKRINLPNVFFESRIRPVKPLLLLIYIWRILFSWRALRKMQVTSDCVIISASHLFHDTLPLLLQKKRATEFVYAYHLLSFCANRKGIATRISILLERLSLWVVASRNINIITSSDVVRTQLESLLPNTVGSIALTRNGVAIDTIRGVPSQEKTLDVVFCGRFVQHKGVLDLLNAISLMSPYMSISTVLIGSGPDLNKISKLINELHLDNVRVVTDADDNEKFRIMKSARLLVLPSYEEGWGIVIGEALACGINVLAYDVKEIHSIWADNVTWVEKGDIKMLASEMHDILHDSNLNQHNLEHWQTELAWKNILADEIKYFSSVHTAKE